VDIFIGAHAGYYGGREKAAARKANPNGPNPFIDPDGYRRYIEDVEKRFNEQLQRERSR
jgi:metallo-beta-lactamase class B